MPPPARIAIVGAGPAGLYSAVLLRKRLPRARVDVYERNGPDDTYGWGVVFSDATMANLRDADAESHAAIVERFHHWDDLEVRLRDDVVRTGGHGFCGIARTALLRVLQERAQLVGAALHFGTAASADALADADLVVAADGVHSRTRDVGADTFRPHVDVRRCRYIWLGTRRTFDAFTFAFEETEHGWFQVHAYTFSPDLSTVIVETRDETWRAHGLDRADAATSIAFCERLFARHLGGARLLANARHRRGSEWLRFHRVACERWHDRRRVLVGDAAHTAHFSIGSGTKLAMEDAIALARHVAEGEDLARALDAYEAERKVEVLRLQSAARNRTEWFENVARYVDLPPLQFAYSLVTGSQRIGHASLRARDPAFVARVEADLAARAGVAPRPPMFLPFEVRGLRLANRVVVSPMDQYSAKDGVPGDWHLVHYGARATGGAGLVFTEMTCTSPDARITTGCTGLWNEAQAAAWRRIVDFVHGSSQARIALQLGHAGRKGATQLGWEEMDRPIPSGRWPLLAPSPIPYLEGVSDVPRPMTRDDMDRVRDEFARAARLGAEAGFDLVELHMAHGYLLASFLSPLTNRRDDAYGGRVANRLRFPLEVLAAVRAAWPHDRPVSVRISATDWAPGGTSEEDLVAIARALKEGGADLLHVSTGQTVPWQEPVYGRMWQTPFADLVRNVVRVPTIAVGNIYEADHVNAIVASGRADLCALARPHLANAAWTLAAAAEQRFEEQWWPVQYLTGKRQLTRNLETAAALARSV